MWLAIGCLVFFVQLPAAERPNVVLVMTDDRGLGDQGCYGMVTNIGRLLATLKKQRLNQDTIFMTDNGTARGATFTDYRGNEGKQLCGYNAGMPSRKGAPPKRWTPRPLFPPLARRPIGHRPRRHKTHSRSPYDVASRLLSSLKSFLHH